MPDIVKPKASLVLKHQPNLGEEIADVELQEGEDLVVLAEWKHAYLVKNDDGKLFNVPKDQVEE